MTDLAPTPPGLDDLTTALEPVRRALLDDANAEAQRLISEATRAAALVVDEAQRRADTEVERARRRGLASATARTDQAQAQAQDTAHRELLQVKDGIRRSVEGAVREASLRLRDDDRYPALVRELELQARRQLGPDARIDHDPGARGGISAVDGARRVDYTLPALGARALDALADEVARLWT